MAKSASKRREQPAAREKSDKSSFAVTHKSLDPSLTSLFASSLGPVQAPSKSRYQKPVPKRPAEEQSEDDDDDDELEDTLSSVSDNELSDDVSADEQGADGVEGSPSQPIAVIESSLDSSAETTNKKRKRAPKEDDVEDAYMQRIAREEAKDEEKRKKKQKTKPAEPNGAATAPVLAEESDEDSFTIPKHETQMESTGNEVEELEKASRTVFLGNISNEAITSKSSEKQLKQYLSSFVADLADSKPPHKVESIRFRSTAFASALPKRAAFAKKEIMDTTTKSTNAYAVYSTKVAAREAVKRLNGTVVLGRHLRVDSIAHPSKVDHRRCVFVGNLGFVDDESNVHAEDGKPKKNKPPSDVEEGLWVQFSKAGKVESVRVPRDAQTRVGKGFAYVQFEDENAVEAALLFNDQKYPPQLPRKLRVTRARAQKKNYKKEKAAPPARTPATKSKGGYTAKISGEQRSTQGRARAVLGKSAVRSAESFVFEGHRASSKQGKSGLKLGGKKKQKGPNGRSARSKAWKSSGAKR